MDLILSILTSLVRIAEQVLGVLTSNGEEVYYNKN
jgi:hypothetical protein